MGVVGAKGVLLWLFLRIIFFLALIGVALTRDIL